MVVARYLMQLCRTLRRINARSEDLPGRRQLARLLLVHFVGSHVLRQLETLFRRIYPLDPYGFLRIVNDSNLVIIFARCVLTLRDARVIVDYST